jgi:hypothetical protein
LIKPSKGYAVNQTDGVTKTTLVVIALLLGIIAIRLCMRSEVTVSADSGRYDYVTIVSPLFLYKGNQGVLLLDKRNGNVWFMAKSQDIDASNDASYDDPVLVVHFPFDKLDQPTQ